jgi:hypothetical protein
VLFVERLGFFFLQEPFGRLHDGWDGFPIVTKRRDRHQPEFMRTFTPIQDVSIPLRFAPIDE